MYPPGQKSRKPTYQSFCELVTTVSYNSALQLQLTTQVGQRSFFSKNKLPFLLSSRLATRFPHQLRVDWETPTVPQPNWPGDWLQRVPTASPRCHLCESVFVWYGETTPKQGRNDFFHLHIYNKPIDFPREVVYIFQAIQVFRLQILGSIFSETSMV